MTDREKTISHLQIMHTWASFALENNLDFFNFKHLISITEWTDDAIKLMKEQENDLRIMFNRCQATAKLLTSGSSCDACLLREKCER